MCLPTLAAQPYFPTFVQASDLDMDRCAAYLAGDLAAVVASYACVVALMDDLYAGIEMPSSECSPCYDPPSHTNEIACMPTMKAVYSL